MVGVTYQEIHLFVEFLKEQYGQGRPDYIEALNDLDGLKRTIEQNEEKIIEYSKPCDARKRRIRALERDLLRKKNKELRRKLEELEDDGRVKAKS
ncbi:TPA: hypothetical protein VVL10_001560 [Streptococcus pneumoniae]|nr:hypothetical protein [Streptococcus pneumoniae]HEU4129737.1 hypothetical protein [Streptococcus pneumoniae]HEU8819911.1 hypothetical protein [Streptococcus pneumoniae]